MATKVHLRSQQDEDVTELLTTVAQRELMFAEVLARVGKDHDRTMTKALAVIRCILRARPYSVEELTAMMGASRRSVYRWMVKAGLPSPKEWVKVIRLCYLISDLNRERKAITVKAAAKAHGYPDQFTVARQMRRLFGITPTESRTWGSVDLFSHWLDENL